MGAQLLFGAVSHEGGKYLGEVLLQVVNRGDVGRQLRAVKIFAGCFAMSDGVQFLFTNDKRVLVEILLRELSNNVDKPDVFLCFAECYQALVSRCTAAQSHQQAEALQLFSDIGEDDSLPPAIRGKCSEVLPM